MEVTNFRLYGQRHPDVSHEMHQVRVLTAGCTLHNECPLIVFHLTHLTHHHILHKLGPALGARLQGTPKAPDPDPRTCHFAPTPYTRSPNTHKRGCCSPFTPSVHLFVPYTVITGNGNLVTQEILD